MTAASCLWRGGRPELWQDELVTINIAARPWRHILVVLDSVDAVHGAYYLFMHGWIQVFGTSVASVRAPSALAMAGAAGCVTITGYRWFGLRAGLFAGLVFLVIPSVTRFGQEVRSYALVVLFAALATLLLTLALERPTVPRWAGYAACVAALAALSLVALALVAGHGVGLLVWYGRRRVWRAWLGFPIAAAVGVLSLLKVILLGMSQANRQVLWVPHDQPWVVWPRIYASAAVAWAVVLLALLAWRVNRRRALVGAAVAVVPLVVVWIASLGSLSYFFSKYLLFVIPAWATLAGAGLAALRLPARVAGAVPVARRFVGGATVLPVVALVALGAFAVPGQLAMRGRLSHSWYTYPDPRPRPPLDYSTAAKTIEDRYRPGDGIVYLRGPHWWNMHDVGVRYYLPKDVRPRDVFLVALAADMDTLNAVECPASILCVGAEERIWVVLPLITDNAVAALNGDQTKVLDQHYVQTWVVHPSGMTVALLQRVR